jgi:hypothetical protein
MTTPKPTPESSETASKDTERGGPESTHGRGAKIGVTVVLLAVAGLYLNALPDASALNPDSAVYMGLGRSLARGRGYTFNYEPYGKYPPVLPVMLAGVYATVGENLRALQGLVALCGVGAVIAAFALVRPRAGTAPALGVAVLTALCTWFQGHSLLVVRADVPYAMFSLLALWYAERRLRAPRVSIPRWGIVALLVALAIGTHLHGVALVPAILAAVVLTPGQSAPLRKRILAAGAVTVLCGALAAAWVLRGWEGFHMASYRTLLKTSFSRSPEVLLLRLKLRLLEWAGTPLNIPHHLMPLVGAIAVLGLLVLPGLVRRFRRPRSAAEFYIVSYFLVSAIAGGWGGHERYVIPVVPLLLYYGYESLKLYADALVSWRQRRLAAHGHETQVVGGCMRRVILVVPFLVLLFEGIDAHVRAQYGLEKLDWGRQDAVAQRVKGWLKMRDWVAEHTEPDAVFYPSSGRTWAIAHYFLERRMADVWSSHMGKRLLEVLLESDATYFIRELHHGVSPERFHSIAAPWPQVLTKLEGHKEAFVYRVNREAIEQILAQEGPADDPAAP